MPRLSINGREVVVADGATVLDACEALGIAIPTLCHRAGLAPFTSCMLCVVRNHKSGGLIPACSAPAQEGMAIGTDEPEVRDARRVALELLLSDHLGDCEAPCRRICPAQMNIPLMNRLITAGRADEAARVVKQDIPLGAILGRICPAPCEKGCRRKEHDAPIAICLLKRFAADADLARSAPWRPVPAAPSGRRVAIVGAGPAGMSAAWYLALRGHACTVYDAAVTPGGALLTAVPREQLPADVVAAEWAVIAALGVAFRGGISVGRDVTMADLERDADAVVLAVGPVTSEATVRFHVDTGDRGFRVKAGTGETSRPRVFAAGAATGPSRMAVRALADGKAVAFAVDRFLATGAAGGPPEPFHSVVGRLLPGEIDTWLREGDPAARVTPAAGEEGGFGDDEARREAARCLHCDCRKPDACRLREHAGAYGARQARYKGPVRAAFEQLRQHAGVVYEPGKCIKCGLCVRITERAREPLGLTFVGRGFDVRVAVPFGEPLDRGLGRVAAECVESCPTGALAAADGQDRSRMAP